MIEIEIWHPVRQCSSCQVTTDDEDSQKCQMCNLSWERLYRWDTTKGISISSQWILLEQAMFLDLEFTFPRRILMLHVDGSISHIGTLEIKHILKEDDYWTRKLPQIDVKNLETQLDVKWRKIESVTKSLTVIDSKKETPPLTCPECGETLCAGLASHLSENTHMKEILPGIFLGAQWNAFCEAELKYHKIQAVLNCATEISSAINQTRFGLHYHKLQWDDTMEQVITKELLEILPWIQSHVDNHRPLLIHCAQGRSRSVSVVIGYLMQTTNVTYEDALKRVQIHKPFALPNPNFKDQISMGVNPQTPKPTQTTRTTQIPVL
jgi:hypothetical protein